MRLRTEVKLSFAALPRVTTLKFFRVELVDTIYACVHFPRTFMRMNMSGGRQVPGMC